MGENFQPLAPGSPDVPPTSGCETEMWDGNTKRREGNGISTPSFPARGKQREERQDAKGETQLEKVPAMVRTHSRLKHQHPEGIQPLAEDLGKMESPPHLVSWL